MLKTTPDECKVDFLDCMVGELIVQVFVCRCILGKDENTTRFFVKPMHNKNIPVFCDQEIPEVWRILPVPVGDNQQSRGLIDRKKIGVFEYNIQFAGKQIKFTSSIRKCSTSG